MPRKRTHQPQGNPFSQRIAHLRKQEGLTMSALAGRVGVTPAYISLLEGGERQPSREIVLKLAQAFYDPNDSAAIDELLILAGLSPSHFDVQFQPQDTRAIYEEHLRAHPDDFRTYTALIRLLIRQEDLTTAEELIYSGMKRFQDVARLQALMAQLQICQKAYAPAISFQTAAIELYRKQHKGPKLKQDPDYADLHTNLGVIFFLWGSEAFDASQQTQGKSAVALRDEALVRFRQALDYYRQALTILPADIFLLDEYARICFNIADLSQGDEQSQWWGIAIDAFTEVVCAEDVAALGAASVREANAFLAHAYSKSGRFDEARRLLGVIQSCAQDFWLLHYIKACYFSLRSVAQADRRSDYLDRSLEALTRAMQTPHPQNASREYASIDPDLDALRRGRSEALKTLLATKAEMMTEAKPSLMASGDAVDTEPSA